METAIQLSTLEHHFDVNPETGEIEGEARELETKDLPLIARRLTELANEITAIRDFRDKEIQRVRAICGDRIERLLHQREFFERIAGRFVDEIPDRKVYYPALGRFRFHKWPDKVDSTGYDGMTDEERLHVQNQHKGCFTTKVTVTANKKEIMARLKDVEAGKAEAKPDGFAILTGQDKFEFVPDK